MAERSYRLLFWCLALVGLSADQATKYGVFAWLRSVPGHAHVVYQDPERGGFQIVAQFDVDGDGQMTPHVNHGALFGFLRQHKTLANATFAAISLLAAVAIIAWSMLPATARDGWLCAALGLILGGTLGNLYDRVMFNGVRDFLHWFYLFDWPVFNIADCCLVSGAGLLLVQAFFGQSVVTTTNPPPHEEEHGMIPTEVSNVVGSRS
jgi:lipoprotein signal peptidase